MQLILYIIVIPYSVDPNGTIIYKLDKHVCRDNMELKRDVAAMNYSRIYIIGSVASGKTTHAKEISKKCFEKGLAYSPYAQIGIPMDRGL
jgi:hypothetical protein